MIRIKITKITYDDYVFYSEKEKRIICDERKWKNIEDQNIILDFKKEEHHNIAFFSLIFLESVQKKLNDNKIKNIKFIVVE